MKNFLLVLFLFSFQEAFAQRRASRAAARPSYSSLSYDISASTGTYDELNYTELNVGLNWRWSLFIDSNHLSMAPTHSWSSLHRIICSKVPFAAVNFKPEVSLTTSLRFLVSPAGPDVATYVPAPAAPTRAVPPRTLPFVNFDPPLRRQRLFLGPHWSRCRRH